MKKRFIVFALFIFLPAPLPAAAATPVETVRTYVNQALEVLRDPALQPKSAEEKKRQELLAIYSQMFDELELARRALGANWSKLTPAQQQEFVPLFRRILEKAYMNKILSYTNQKVAFGRETALANNLAEVQTKIITDTAEFPVNYRLIRKDDTWKIYDVVIENVSLVLNYRSQFNAILAKNTPDQLLQILRNKVKAA